jgi:uncharacterized membrane protein YfcA
MWRLAPSAEKGTRLPLEALVVMAVALGCGGLVKGATGMGLPVIALPILAAFLGVPHAVAIMCLPILVTNAWQVWRFREDLWTADFLPVMLAAGTVGIGLGTWLIVSLPERSLTLALAVLVLAYVGWSLAKPHFTISRSLGRRLAPAVGLGAGILQGATGISSPLGVTFIHSLRLHRTAHVFAVSAMFLMFTIVQMPALAIAGVLTWPLVLQGAFAVAPALLAMPLGTRLAARLSQKAFDRLILALLAVVAVQLFAKGL